VSPRCRCVLLQRDHRRRSFCSNFHSPWQQLTTAELASRLFRSVAIIWSWTSDRAGDSFARSVTRSQSYARHKLMISWRLRPRRPLRAFTTPTDATTARRLRPPVCSSQTSGLQRRRRRRSVVYTGAPEVKQRARRCVWLFYGTPDVPNADSLSSKHRCQLARPLKFTIPHLLLHHNKAVHQNYRCFGIVGHLVVWISVLRQLFALHSGWGAEPSPPKKKWIEVNNVTGKVVFHRLNYWRRHWSKRVRVSTQNTERTICIYLLCNVVFRNRLRLNIKMLYSKPMKHVWWLQTSFSPPTGKANSAPPDHLAGF